MAPKNHAPSPPSLAVTQTGLLALAGRLDQALDGKPLSLVSFESACNAAGMNMGEMLAFFQAVGLLVLDNGQLRLGPFGYALVLTAYMD